MTSTATRLAAFRAAAKECRDCDEDLIFSDGKCRAMPLFHADATCPDGVLIVAECPNYKDTFDFGRLTLSSDPKPDQTAIFQQERLLGPIGLRPEHVVFTNAVLCLPKAKGTEYPPTVPQIRRCTKWLQAIIEAADPWVVVTFGGIALDAVGRIEAHGLTLGKSAGKLHSWRNRQLLPLYHPSALGRKFNRSAEDQIRDIAVLGPQVEAHRAARGRTP